MALTYIHLGAFTFPRRPNPVPFSRQAVSSKGLTVTRIFIWLREDIFVDADCIVIALGSVVKSARGKTWQWHCQRYTGDCVNPRRWQPPLSVPRLSRFLCPRSAPFCLGRTPLSSSLLTLHFTPNRLPSFLFITGHCNVSRRGLPFCPRAVSDRRPSISFASPRKQSFIVVKCSAGSATFAFWRRRRYALMSRPSSGIDWAKSASRQPHFTSLRHTQILQI